MKGELYISAREATACTYLPDDITRTQSRCILQGLPITAQEINVTKYDLVSNPVYVVVNRLHNFPGLASVSKRAYVNQLFEGFHFQPAPHLVNFETFKAYRGYIKLDVQPVEERDDLDTYRDPVTKKFSQL
jgi:hypothetical protein